MYKQPFQKKKNQKFLLNLKPLFFFYIQMMKLNHNVDVSHRSETKSRFLMFWLWKNGLHLTFIFLYAYIFEEYDFSLLCKKNKYINKSWNIAEILYFYLKPTKKNVNQSIYNSQFDFFLHQWITLLLLHFIQSMHFFNYNFVNLNKQ